MTIWTRPIDLVTLNATSKNTLVEHGFRLPSAHDNRPLKFEEFEEYMKSSVFVSATPGNYEAEHQGQVVEQVVRPTGLLDPEIEVRPATSQVDDLMSEISLRVADGDRVLVTTLTKRMSEDLTDYLSEHGVKVRVRTALVHPRRTFARGAQPCI